MKFFYRVLLLCVVFSAAAGLLPAQSQYRMAGYYPSWKSSVLPAAGLHMNDLTHVIHAFASPNTNGTFSVPGNIPDQALVSAVHKAGEKLLLSFGGASNNTGFDAIIMSPQLRATFIKNTVDFLTVNHYDGADIDYEGPSPLTAAQRDSLTMLMKELRLAFSAADTSYCLTMAIPVSPYWGVGYNFTALVKYVDWFNAMTYDYHGSWTAHAGPNAPLYAPASDVNDYSVDQSIQYLQTTRGIPGSKLLLGLAFYGKKFTASGMYAAQTGETDLAYTDVASAIQGGRWTYNWDTVAKVPYLIYAGNSSVITYDDSLSIAVKCAYARARGLGGIMIWELSQDVVSGGQPLLDAAAAAMKATPAGVEVVSGGVRSERYSLSENYPNPFNPSTTIRFSLPVASHVLLTVYNALGEQVLTLLDEDRAAGLHAVTLDVSGRRWASGMYFYQLRSGSFSQTKKLALIQ
jgi:chitinase